MQANLGYIFTSMAGAPGTYQNLVYDYDQTGNITAITDNIFTASRTFAYDALNRLTSASGNFSTNQAFQNCAYVYSPVGNIDNKCGVAFTYGDSMHPSAVTSISSGKSYTYDDNGNMATGGGRSFTWDADNRVTSVSLGGSTTYMEYDYTGMRVKKDGFGGLTLYPFQGYEIAPNGEVTKFIRIGVETFAAKKGTSKFYYHNDHLGGVNVITDESGAKCQLNEYDPWGSVSRSEGPTPGSQPTCDLTHRFTGKELDPETGLYYYGGRYYDPEISRFISADSFVQAPGDPQNLNRYSYVINNPRNYIDPSGYGFWKKFKKFFKKVFHVFNKYVLPGVCPVCYGISKLPPNVRHGLEIFGGIAMMLNRATFVPGLFFTLSGATGFGKSNGWQIASGIFGFLGGMGLGGGGNGGGGGGSGGGNDFPGGGFGGLMLVNALGGLRQGHKYRVDKAGVDFIQQFEGPFLPRIERDVGGIPTIGYGHRVFPGENIKEPWSEADSLRQLDVDLQNRVNRYLDQINVPLWQNQVNALGSFIYNAGGGAFTRNVLPELNAGNYGAVPDIIGRFVRDARGVIQPGLVRRRALEGEMFITY